MIEGVHLNVGSYSKAIVDQYLLNVGASKDNEFSFLVDYQGAVGVCI